MRKTSRVLGVIGGCLALVLGGLILLGGFYIGPFSPFVDVYPANSGSGHVDASQFNFMLDLGVNVTNVTLGCAALLAGILGIIAGICITRRNVLSGALNIIAAVLSSYTIVCAVLFILATVFALKKAQPGLPAEGI